jgi:hypothetical protein
MAKQVARNGHVHFEQVISDAYHWADELEALTAEIQSKIEKKDHDERR